MVSKLLGYVIDFFIGMIVAAYLLSHTETGIALYSHIAKLPTITEQQVKQFSDSAIGVGKGIYKIGDKIYRGTVK